MFDKHLRYFLAYVVLLTTVNSVSFSASSGIGYSIAIEGDVGDDGSIVSYKDGKYYLANTTYDENIYGVVADNTGVSIEDVNLTNSRLVVSSGDADVLVSTQNGAIKRGDFITTSNKPGVGMKATKSGQVVGVATQDFTSDNPDDVGKILVYVNIHSQFIGVTGSTNVLTALKAGLDANLLSPLISLRYILAAVVAGMTFAIGFRSFGKVSSSSVDALGRNPLASVHIRRIVTFNFLLTFFIMLAGLVIAYLILIL